MEIGLSLNMSKLNSSFLDYIKKYKHKTALILENSKKISYQNLINNSQKISKNLENEKMLVFLLGQNNFETLAGYISFINKGFAVVLLDGKINELLLNKLISTYKPQYVFCEKIKKFNTKYFEILLNFKNFNLYKAKKYTKIEIHKDLALLMSTSGSTGSPKLVKLTYENLLSNTKNIIKYLKIKKEDTSITSLPISYVYGLSIINTHLLSGGKIVLTNRSMIEKEFWNLINKFKVNNLSGVPYNYNIIQKIFEKKVPKSLKYATQAGGKLNHKLIKNIIQIFEKNKIKFIQMYGAAEASARMTYLDWKYAKKKIGSIGKSIPLGKIYIIDRNNNKIKENFKKGELVYEGKNVCMGYANNYLDLALPDKNKGLLNTGDIGYVDNDGFFFITGRKNRYAKIYGIRVNLSELETLLLTKGIEVIMKEAGENKIYSYFKNVAEIKKGINFLLKITCLNKNVFINKIITKKNLTNNFKYKIA